MKKGLIYMLLLSYTTIMLKPVLPFLTDAVAHIFWYADHISTVHYEKGKYHVHFESVEAAKKTNPEKSVPVTKTETASSEHFINVALYDFACPRLLQKQFSYVHFYFPHTWLSGNYPPPKMS